MSKMDYRKNFSNKNGYEQAPGYSTYWQKEGHAKGGRVKRLSREEIVAIAPTLSPPRVRATREKAIKAKALSAAAFAVAIRKVPIGFERHTWPPLAETLK